MSWETARGYAWVRALRLFAERPFGALLAIVIAALALAAPVVGFMATQAVPGPLLPAAEMSAFVAPGLAQAETKALAGKLGALDGVAAVRFVSRAEAWSEMQKRSKELQALPEARFNTLPDVFVVQFSPGVAAATVEAAVAAASKLPRVDSVQADLGWYRRLSTVMRFGSVVLQASLALGALLLAVVLLGCVSAVATPDTGELRVLDQIGADRDFARRPFVYAGALALGLAALLALGLAAGVRALTTAPMKDLGQAFGFDLVLVLPPWPLAVSFVAAALLAGAVFAYVFAGRAVVRAGTWHISEG